MVNPVAARIGGSSAATNMKRYQGTPKSSERSKPNTSHATASSNGDTSCPMTAATVWRLRRDAMAGFSRTLSILSLAEFLLPLENGHMFAVWCERHETRVLLWPACITALERSNDDLAVHWRCPCGEEGRLLCTRSLQA